MLSALLRSGDVKDYTALGQDGQAVFSVASQLRDTIRFKRGRMFSDYLAVPQRNDQGSRIDWYVPFESKEPDGQYLIVPWTSATAEEREQALSELDVFERNMMELGEEMANSSNLKGDTLLFSRLLYAEPQNPSSSENLKALRFPNSEHVYLVNGRPVITFWGFTEKNANVYGSPFLPLKPVTQNNAPQVAPVTQTVQSPVPPVIPVPREKKHHKCWCFLPLLLLLLLIPLIMYLLGFFDGKLGFNLPQWQQNSPQVAVESEASEVYKLDNVEYRKIGQQWLNGQGDIITDPVLLSHLNGNNQTPLSSEGDEVMANAANNSNDNAESNTQNQAPEMSATDPVKSEHTSPESQNEDKNTEPVSSVANQPANASNASEGEKKDATTEPSTAINQPAYVPSAAQNSATNGAQKLQIPTTSLTNGNVDFLNGNWHAGAGIQDKTTGKPLSLDYHFENGVGKVKLQRGDGVQCTGNVNANIKSGGLNISNQGMATCSDGSTYQLPNVECKASVTNATDCQGINEQSRFPMSIRK